MELTEKLADIIVGLKFAHKPIAVAVCGAADLGKTHLAVHLVSSIKKLGISADHITLDSYLTARDRRIKSGVSGYEVEAYDLAAIEKDIAGFMRGLPITFRAYNHSKGFPHGPERFIQPCSVLIVDGLHAMHERFAPWVAYSIFICTDDTQLQDIRHSSDITKRNQTIEFSRSNLDSEFEKYKMYVAPYKDRADVVLTLIKKWEYKLHVNNS